MDKKNKFEFDNLGLVKKFFEDSKEGILVADFKTKKFIYANNKICEILGYKKNKLLTLGVEDIHKKIDLKTIYKEFSSVAIGKKRLAKSFPVLKSNKQVIFCDIGEMAIKIKNQKVILGFFNEVNEIEDIIKNIKEVEKSQKEIFDALPGLLIFFDLKGRIRFLNNEAFYLLGNKKSDLIGESIFDVMPEKKLILKNAFKTIVKTGKTEEFEDEIRKPSGEIGNFFTVIKPVKNKDGKIIGLQLSSFELKERRALEKLARGKELIYSEMFQGSVIPMFAIDLKHKITHWNRACEEITGFLANKMIGTSFQWKPFYKKARPVLADLVLDKTKLKNISQWYGESGKVYIKKSLEIPDVYQGENFFSNMGNNGKWLYFVATTIKDKAGKVIGAIETLEDVTVEKTDKQRLIESEERFRDLYENVPGVVYRCANDKNRTMIYLSQGIKEMSGYENVDIVGNKNISYEKLIHPADKVAVRRELSSAIKKDKIFEIDYRLLTKNADIRWVHERGRAIYGRDGKMRYIDGLLFDFTDRKKVSEELRQEKELTQKYLELVGVMMVVLDKAGNVLLINKNGLDILGRKKEEVIGKNWFNNFLPKEGCSLVKKVFRKIIEGESIIVEYYENDVVNAKNERRTIFWHNSVIKNEAGKIISVISSGADVTEKNTILKNLADSERKYRTLVEFAGDSILLINLKGVIVEANRAIMDKLGYKKEYIVGKHLGELTALLPLESMRLVLKNFANRLVGRESGPYVIKMISKKGVPGFFEISASIIKDGNKKFGVLAIIRDVNEREKDRQLIRDSEYKYRTLITNIPNVVYTILPDKHRTCLYMSERWKKWTGYSPEEFYADKHLWFKTIVSDDRKKVSLTMMNAFLGKKSYVLEYRVKHRDNNKIHYILDQGIPYKDNKGVILNYSGIITDITKLKLIDKKLKESEERFRDISFSSGDIIWEVDLNGKYTFVAGDVERVLSYPIGEIIGKKVFDFMPKDEEMKMKKEIKEAILNKRNIVDFENWRLSKDGKSQIMLSNGRILIGEKEELIGFRGVDKVITERKMSEIKIRASEEKLKIIVESIGDGVMVLDKDYKIVMFNKEATIISGFSREDVIGKRYDETLSFLYEDSGVSNREFVNFLVNKKVISIKNTLLVRKDGARVSVADSAEILKDEKGEAFGYVLVFRDISREREIDKMKSEFISVASHQLKTPLSGIKWFTELLLREKVGSLNEKQEDFINQIRISNERLIALVSDLLSVSRIETGKKFEIIKQKVEFCKIIKRIIEASYPLLKKHDVKIVQDDCLSENIEIEVDEEKIQQVLINLITNAIKYSHDGGEIFIGVEVEKSYIIFFVQDGGIGIEEKDFPKVFSKFYRGNNALKLETDGTGLGLYIAKAIVEGHGGSIWFDSKKGQGSTFYFSIPKN